MNNNQKQVAQAQLTAEQKTLAELKQVYKKASDDCAERLKELSARTDLENLQSIIYQKRYQEMLKKQLDEILDDMNKNQYKDISSYLKGCYESGYVGTMYDIAGQGIPIIAPIQQNQVVKAIKTDSKINTGLYEKLGEDVSKLKTSIRAEVSRGIANGSTWNQVAVRIAKGMNSPFNKALNKAVRIARTEGHRIQCEAALDAQNKAKSKGADVVKQWDSTLDGRTRPSHRKLDGQIREVSDEFEVDGMKAMAPSMFGDPAEDCNCRCALLQRARWALDDEELQILKDRAAYFDLDKTKDFEDFKEKYLGITEEEAQAAEGTDEEWENFLNSFKKKETDEEYIPFALKESKDEHANAILKNLSERDIFYNPVKTSNESKDEETIINVLSGGDMTRGSCASVGLAYIGQKQGWDVLDFRDGESRFFFSQAVNLYSMSNMEGISALHYGDVVGKSPCTLANNFLKTCEQGKEYYLCVGRHAAIVRKNDEGKLQYLELQSSTDSGWTNFNGNPRYTLTQRFGCSSASGGAMFDFMMNITDSNFDTPEFRTMLGYLNTDEDGQKKGKSGTIK